MKPETAVIIETLARLEARLLIVEQKINEIGEHHTITKQRIAEYEVGFDSTFQELKALQLEHLRDLISLNPEQKKN